MATKWFMIAKVASFYVDTVYIFLAGLAHSKNLWKDDRKKLHYQNNQEILQKSRKNADSLFKSFIIHYSFIVIINFFHTSWFLRCSSALLKFSVKEWNGFKGNDFYQLLWKMLKFSLVEGWNIKDIIVHPSHPILVD